MPDTGVERAPGGTWRPSRALVVASWVAWPLVVAALNLWLAPGGECVGREDCPSHAHWWQAALWIALAVLPGTLLLALRRRAARRAAA